MCAWYQPFATPALIHSPSSVPVRIKIACASLCFNIGVCGFEESTVARMCNANNFSVAAQAFLLWDKVKGVVNQGLLNRRQKEMALFLS